MIIAPAKTGIHRAVIPAKAAIQVATCAMSGTELGPGLRRGDGNCVISAKAGIHQAVIPAKAGIQVVECARNGQAWSKRKSD
jgi:hypothetical protein